MNRKEEIIFIRDYLSWKKNINFWKKGYKWQTKEKIISNKKYLYNLLNTNTNIKKNIKYSSSWVEHILVAKKYLEPYINDIINDKLKEDIKVDNKKKEEIIWKDIFKKIHEIEEKIHKLIYNLNNNITICTYEYINKIIWFIDKYLYNIKSSIPKNYINAFSNNFSKINTILIKINKLYSDDIWDLYYNLSPFNKELWELEKEFFNLEKKLQKI